MAIEGREIQDKAKYRNAVWVRVGKAAMERWARKKKRFTWYTADPEQNGKVNGVSLTQ